MRPARAVQGLHLVEPLPQRGSTGRPRPRQEAPWLVGAVVIVAVSLGLLVTAMWTMVQTTRALEVRQKVTQQVVLELTRYLDCLMVASRDPFNPVPVESCRVHLRTEGG